METEKMNEMFISFKLSIDRDFALREELRNVVRELEAKGREILVILQKTHSSTDDPSMELDEANKMFANDVRPLYAKLGQLIPVAEYYRYHDMFRFINQRMSFLASFMAFIRSSQLITRDEAANQLGVAVDSSKAFHLDLEDYLCGLLQMASELARYSINSVAAGDNGCPFRVAAFLTDLDAKFRLLNLKNDGLRKRFDALKYDVQKVEHVVYDLTIRGLKPSS